MNRKMPAKTKRAIEEYAQTLPASSDRAQCYTLANYTLCDETIAQRIIRDHSSFSDIIRAMSLMAKAKCATKETRNSDRCGLFIFEDDSSYFYNCG